MSDTEFRFNVFKRAALCRNFEEYVFGGIRNKLFKVPIYLSGGQEYISATIAEVMIAAGINPDIFIQHRGHSTYLSYEASPEELIDELLGRKTGCANGMGGSASIQSKEKKIYGHDGLMGSQVPIAVGHCYSTKHPTIVHIGDASAEEDYVLGALNWELADVAKAFNMRGLNVDDHPLQLREALSGAFEGPLLLNIHTHRKFWHAGAGIDDENIFDRYETEKELLGDRANCIHDEAKQKVAELWKKQLEIQ